MKLLTKDFCRYGLSLAFVSLALLLVTSAALADSIYTFHCLDSGANCGIASQFSVEVTSLLDYPHTVLFTIRNDGPVDSSITAVYWDDNAELLDISSTSPWIYDSSDGVSFSLGTKGPNLPGGNTIGFLADVHGARDGSVFNGIDPDEYLSVLFNLEGSDTTLEDVLNAMDGDLRVGLHVQRIGSVTSGDEGTGTAFVTPSEPLTTPEPTSLLLLGTGMGVMGLIAYKRNRK